MTRSLLLAALASLVSLVACSGADDAAAPQTNSDAANGGAGASSSSPGTGPNAGGSGSGGGGGATSGAADGGASTNDGNAGSSGVAFAGGNPHGSCSAGLPARAAPVDVTQPSHVVGSGTPASCTEAALRSALMQGGVVTFACGPLPVAIAVTQTIELPVDRDVVIDGKNLVTLDGKGTARILRWNSPDFRANEHTLTLQHLRLVGGKTTPTVAIPPAPAPCSQGFDDGEGGALYMRDGNLNVIDCVFDGNTAAPLGPDTGGGAFYIVGSKHGATIAKSTFTNNHASNGAGVGALFAELDVYDSLFSGNVATGNGANSDDASKCSVINNGQHEVGSGGNGGAIYSDGASVDVTLCGDAIDGNHAGTGAFGGGLFFTSNDFGGTLTIADTTMTNNTGGHWTIAASGSVQDAGTAVGTNAKSITITGSTLQGL